MDQALQWLKIPIASDGLPDGLLQKPMAIPMAFMASLSESGALCRSH
jgi:hypothetical protein